MGGLDDHERFDDFCGDVLDFGINFGRDGVFGSFVGKYSKRRRSNVAVIIVRILFIGSFLFCCLLLTHTFSTNPNRILLTAFNLFFSILQLYKLHLLNAFLAIFDF